MTQMSVEQALDLGVQHHQAGRFTEAESIYRQVLAAQPNHPDALHLLGFLALHVGKPDAAIALIGRAIALNHDSPDYYNNLGQAFAALGRHDSAIGAYTQAVKIKPDFPEALNNHGNSLKHLKQLDRAIAMLHRTLELKPGFVEAHNNLGTALEANSELDAAIAEYRKAIELRPDLANAHYNLSHVLLLTGQLEEGFREHEWRWRVPELRLARTTFPQPEWDGGDLNGRRILLYTEQGFGDAIQFIRYVPLVTGRGGKVIVACRPEMVPLIRNMPEISEVATAGDPIPAIDVHFPLLSLPRIFKTTLSNVPATVPYLRADADRSVRWKARLTDYQKAVKIGLTWAGRADHVNDSARSISLSALAPFWEMQGIRWISLQKGHAAPWSAIVDWTHDLNDFADTAALIDQLDLVITVDTAVAHLAGAMGKPTWLMLPSMPDWRWLLDRNDSPWYPTMRLFRQTTAGGWSSVIHDITRELQSFKIER